MGIYFESMEMFQKDGGLKQTTITAKQLLPAIVTHMKRGDRQFSLYLQGRLPKSVPDLLQEAFHYCIYKSLFIRNIVRDRRVRSNMYRRTVLR